MLISNLELKGVRNHDHFLLEPDPHLTILVGPNAVGKTNVIEAIQLLTANRSFRNPQWADIVKWGAGQASLRMTLDDDGVTTVFEMVITPENRRSYKSNGVTKRRFSDIPRTLPSVVFTPDDLLLAKGPAENRRKAIDDLGERLSKTYGSIKRDYTRTVRQRNAALKESKTHQATLQALDEQLISIGSSLCLHRRRLLQRMSPITTSIYGTLATGEILDIQYESRVLGDIPFTEKLRIEDIQIAMSSTLQIRRSEEVARKTTLVGPHRDDVIFKINGRDARSFASQGQQRTVALAWKCAEVRIIQEIARQTPVLLLDDVMSELDSTRREALTTLVRDGVQTIVTTTNTGYFAPDLLAQAKIVEIPGRD